MYIFQLLHCSKHLCRWWTLSSQLLQQSPASVVEDIAPAPSTRADIEVHRTAVAVIAALVPVEEYNATALAVTTATAPGVEYIPSVPAAIAVPARVVEYIAPAPAAIAALSPVVKLIPPVITVSVVPALAVCAAIALLTPFAMTAVLVAPTPAVCAAPADRVQWKAKDAAASHLSTAVAFSRDIAASPPLLTAVASRRDAQSTSSLSSTSDS